MQTESSRNRSLTRQDWIEAALDAMRRDGFPGVSVEPLAERLGATKGSFYWHFKDRNALIEAAMRHWEQVYTDDFLAELDAIADPHRRWTALLDRVGENDDDRGIFVLMLWHADHDIAGPITERVLRKRLEFSLRLRDQLGFHDDEGGNHVLLAYSVWLGMYLMRRGAPTIFGGPTDYTAFGEYAMRALDAIAPCTSR